VITQKHAGIAFSAGRWPIEPKRPTVIFIHGAGQRGSMWQAQVEGLSDVANTIALDLPGHGASDGPGCRQIAAYARAVVDAATALAIERPLICGISMGGAITLHLLIHHADRIGGGILVNTGARLKVLPIIIDTIERDFAAHLEGLIDFTVAKVNQEDAAICGSVMASAIDSPTVTADDFRACDAFDETQRATGIRLPVLVLSARQDVLTPVRYADWLAAHIPGARHVTIDAAGHMSPIEQPQAVNTAMRGFIRSL
jgi:pimeloyl-ACP methyl ester carboxylesterase